MRVGFVTTEYVTEQNFDGGLANYLQRVCLSLRDLHHEPVVIVISDRDEVVFQDNIEVHRVRIQNDYTKLEYFHKITRSYLRISQTLIEQTWRLNTKVRELHATKPFSLIQYANVCALFRSREIPSVVRLSSYRPLWQAADAYPHKHPFQIWQMAFWEKQSFMRADALYAPSSLIAKAVEEVIKRPVDVIEPPFTLDTLSEDWSVYKERLRDKTYLLFFGRLDMLKGVVTIAGMIRELLQSHPHIFFVFLGREYGGYQRRPMMDYLLKQAGEYRNQVLHLGRLKHEQLYPILSNAKAVVLPSRIDNFPNTCLEAMAHQRVVIGTRGASFEQLLVNGETGFLCEIDNPASLLAAIEKTLSLSDEQRQAIGKKAQQRVHQLKPEKVIPRLVEYYNDVIAEHRMVNSSSGCSTMRERPITA